ncbi:MAG: RCC1 repeat-containing protein, partial [Myxococcota bacterium]
VEVDGVDDVTQVVAGGLHTCARREDGAMFCWGRNDRGQLGDGTFEQRTRAVEVTGLTDVVDMCAGDGHSCAVDAGGRVWCWGENAAGQLGQPIDSPTESTVPLVVESGLPPAVGVACSIGVEGADSTCATLADGLVWCWGSNAFGQLATETSTPTPSPQVPEGVTSLAMGTTQTCAIVDGAIRCWGIAEAPEELPAGGFTSLTLGGLHGCGLQQDGGLWCFGDDADGQLGDGPDAI